jgi:hypothetical protein
MLILHSKRDFADVIKLRILIWKVTVEYIGGSNVFKKVFVREGER